MKKLNKFLALALLLALAVVASVAPATATPKGSAALEATQVSCADEGFTGLKLEWCRNICEKGYTGATLNIWIRRWVDRYRTLPACALD